MTSQAIYCFDRAVVQFAFYPKGSADPRVLAEICEDALRDIFGAREGGESLVQAARDNFDLIEATALQRYRDEPSKPIELQISDFACTHCASAACC